MAAEGPEVSVPITESKDRSHLYELISKLSADLLIKNAAKSNQQWLHDNPEDWLTMNWQLVHHKSSVFMTTSCEITAASIRTSSGLGSEWLINEDKQTFKQIQILTPIFQITIGETWDSIEHIITIWGNHLIQSYFKHYEAKLTIITPQIINAIDNIDKDNNYEIVTSVKDKPKNTMNVFYWIPNIKSIF